MRPTRILDFRYGCLAISCVLLASACTVTPLPSSPRGEKPGIADRQVVVTARDLTDLLGHTPPRSGASEFRKHRLPGGVRKVSYVYAPTNPDLTVECEVVSFPSGVSAAEHYGTELTEYRLRLEERAASEVPIEHRIAWGDETTFSLLKRGKVPYGNAFFSYRDNVAFRLIITGIYFDEAWMFERLVARPLQHLLRYDPVGDARAVVKGPTGPPEMDFFFYDVAEGDGTRKVLVLAPVDEALGGGLPSSAIVGSYAPGVEVGAELSTEGFVGNETFQGLMQGVISANIYAIEPLHVAASNAADGEILFVDMRSRTPQGHAPSRDILGTLRVHSGKIVAGSYRANPAYELLTEEGLPSLPASLARKLKDVVWELAWQAK